MGVSIVMDNDCGYPMTEEAAMSFFAGDGYFPFRANNYPLVN